VKIGLAEYLLPKKSYNNDLEASYQDLIAGINPIERVVYLHENIIVLNDILLVGTNGWTTFDFTYKSTVYDTMQFLTDKDIMSEQHANDIFKLAIDDQHYLYKSIEACQTFSECRNIVLITSSVPKGELIAHHNDYDGTLLGDMIGNSGMDKCLENDTLKKVNTWVFGKFPDELDYVIDDVRYVNNPLDIKDIDIYFPKRIDV